MGKVRPAHVPRQRRRQAPPAAEASPQAREGRHQVRGGGPPPPPQHPRQPRPAPRSTGRHGTGHAKMAPPSKRGARGGPAGAERKSRAAGDPGTIAEPRTGKDAPSKSEAREARCRPPVGGGEVESSAPRPASSPIAGHTTSAGDAVTPVTLPAEEDGSLFPGGSTSSPLARGKRPEEAPKAGADSEPARTRSAARPQSPPKERSATARRSTGGRRTEARLSEVAPRGAFGGTEKSSAAPRDPEETRR